MITLERAFDLLDSKFNIVTTNTAVLNPKKVSHMGVDSVSLSVGSNHNEQELNNLTVTAKKSLKDIVEISANGFSLSITPKGDIPKVIDYLESIIECLYRVKGTNNLNSSIKIPNSRITVAGIVDFYSTLTGNNMEAINKLISNEIDLIDDGFVVLGDSSPIANNNIVLKTGMRFIDEISNKIGGNNVAGMKNKFSNKGLRDGY